MYVFRKNEYTICEDVLTEDSNFVLLFFAGCNAYKMVTFFGLWKYQLHPLSVRILFTHEKQISVQKTYLKYS
ncbi:hypothetical protein DLM75_16080 [Leptospira stimsonii]|uniref:Uncharacterized protein n=1 Tax=Leptospira stimsonii TaxID=2202203 RepID=A0A396Z1H1_9LEPT|nr:hypothetical protein DLM75_16080 [Leptospira stimsonii]